MRTQLEQAKAGRLTPAMRSVARAEGIEARALFSSVGRGEVVIMRRGRRALGIGKGLRTKVNVNIGTSPLKIDPEEEVEKAILAENHGADTLSDLSMGGNIREIRRMIFHATRLPITTVPMYQAVAEIGLPDLDEDRILGIMKEQAREGVSSFVVHLAGKRILAKYRRGRRIMGVVSKGGSLALAWMKLSGRENPFMTCLDEVLGIARRHDIVLSLGNTMRSGCIHDPMDRAQREEMELNAELANRAREQGVQVVIEGMGGHVRADRIAATVRRYKRASTAPLFVAGPLPTDIAVGHDHIAGCVGASLAAGAGADYLCYITPAEHLGLPDAGQVKEGLMAFRIAAHIGDSIKYGPGPRDRCLAERRAGLDWAGQFSYALDGETARALAPAEGPCTMCGEYCAIKMMRGL
ncbi:MAG TPA: phosphomethylpyrimidine synthase ThiC [Methanomicrobiales archaeon]|jgi:phosphomethylpyrimidine synthase|nr:phosphomethylpyrimidine synthase ThiC [Methanomicrobiales archaeon]